jgi:hypothetical protein
MGDDLDLIAVPWRETVYGVSRAGRWWYGWLAWPTSSDGAHWSDSRRPFRWWARLRAWKMSRRFVLARPASEAEVRDHEVGGTDPARWGGGRPYG